MEPPENARRRLILIMLISLFLWTIRKNPSPEEMKRMRYGDIEVELVKPTNIEIQQPNDDAEVIRIHLFKHDSNQQRYPSSAQFSDTNSSNTATEKDEPPKTDIDVSKSNPPTQQLDVLVVT